MNTLQVIGLDLSLTASGICLPDGTTHTIKTNAKDGDRRLLHIGHAIANTLAPGADLAVVEDIPQNSFAAKPISMVHGVVRAALLEAGVPYVLVTAATLKKFATGKGSGDKIPMAIAALKRAGREFPDDNQCDAWWLRHAGLDALGQPEIAMPADQRAALNKVTWPQLTTRSAA